MATDTRAVTGPNTCEGMLAVILHMDVAESMTIVFAPGSWLWERVERVVRTLHRGRRSSPFEDRFYEVLAHLARRYKGIVKALRKRKRDAGQYLHACIRHACWDAASAARPTRREVPFSAMEGAWEGEGGYEATIPDRSEAPDARCVRDELSSRLHAAISQLRLEDQPVLWFYLQIGNLAEVARVTGMTDGEARASLGRSVSRLRFLLSE